MEKLTDPPSPRPAGKKRSTCILVLGAHRSGTSATTRVFNLIGAKIADEVVGAATSNLKGHWEPKALVELHEELLQATQSSWDDLAPFDINCLSKAAQEGYRRRILRTLEDSYGDTEVFVLKDPRICRFLPLWLDILTEFGADAKVVIPLRNPLEVAGSLAARDRMDLTYAQFLWLRYVSDAERDSRSCQRVFFDFSELLANWPNTIARLCAVLDLRLTWNRDCEKEIDAFLSTELRHQRRSAEDLKINSTTPALVANTFPLMQQLIVHDQDHEVFKRLDQIKNELDGATRDILFATRVESENRRRTINDQNRAIHLKDVALGEVQATASTQTARAETLQHQVQTANERFAEFGITVGRLRTEIERLGVEDSRLHQELRAESDRLGREIGLRDQAIVARDQLLAGMHSSFSWQVTKPVRSLSSAFPGITRRAKQLVRLSYWIVTLRLRQRLEQRRKFSQEIETIRKSSMFDDRWYHQAYADIPATADAAVHFVQHGRAEKRSPSAAFDAEQYLEKAPDVAGSQVNPLLHYIQFGVYEGRKVSWLPETSVSERLGATSQGEIAFEAAVDIGRQGDHLVALSPTSSIRFRTKKPGLQGWLRIEAVFQVPGQGDARAHFDLGSGYPNGAGERLWPLGRGLYAADVFAPHSLREIRIEPPNRPGIFDLALLTVEKLTIGYTLSNLVEGLKQGSIERNLRLLRPGTLLSKRPAGGLHYDVTPDYQNWINKFDFNYSRDAETYRGAVGLLTHKPLFSILMPTYETPEDMLNAAIESVRSQIYPNWELCIADDCSRNPRIKEILKDYATKDSRIKFVIRDQNGHIAEATNSAFSLAKGEWIALLDHDDLLRQHALAEVALLLAKNPHAQVVYSDEDKISEDAAERFDPYFKPDFSPDLFRAQNYVNHLSVHRAENIRKVGGWRRGYEGSQDYDLNLRIFEMVGAKGFVHIPKVLYHWRAAQGSVASDQKAKNYALSAAQRALEDHLERTGTAGSVEPAGGGAPFHRIRYASPTPLVSLIIPTRDKADILRLCVESILEKTSYQNYEIIVVDNGSAEAATRALFESFAPNPRIRLLHYNEVFNYSAINNFAVRNAKGEIVGLLNNDVEVISPEWLDEMVALAWRSEIGCVGAKLYYPNNLIQHAGVIVGLGGVAGHSHKYYPREHPGYFWRLHLPQNVSAVTGACLIVRKEVYEAVGGLDEKELAVAFNDVDFCLKVSAAGYLNVWTPQAELYHHESLTRGEESTEEQRARFLGEISVMRSRWGSRLAVDPYYSSNLTLDREDFGIRTR